MILLFNHSATKEQQEDASKSLGVTDFVYLPEKLQNIWSRIPPELKSLDEYLKPIKDFLAENTKKDAFVLVQGDFGATYIVVNFLKTIGAKPLYATTSRDVIEVKDGDKIIKKSIFKHERFREYE